MGTGFEQKSVYNARHVARHALAGFRALRMMCVLRDAAAILRVTTDAHLIRIALEFQRGKVLRKIGEVRSVTARALGRSFPVTGRSCKGLNDERRLPKSSVLIKRPA